MANISTREGAFTVHYEARGEDGEKHGFESQYAPDGGVIFERRLDTISFGQRWLEDRRRATSIHSPALQCGIYEWISSSDLLAFLDKSASEECVFLNWRVSTAPTYSRAAIGKPQFFHYGPEPHPAVSEIVYHDQCLGVAWIRCDDQRRELVFTRVSVRTETTAEHVIDQNIPFTTSISAATIGPHVIVVRHTAMQENEDSAVVPYFFELATAI